MHLSANFTAVVDPEQRHCTDTQPSSTSMPTSARTYVIRTTPPADREQCRSGVERKVGGQRGAVTDKDEREQGDGHGGREQEKSEKVDRAFCSPSYKKHSWAHVPAAKSSRVE